jgi:hypothetical protein
LTISSTNITTTKSLHEVFHTIESSPLNRPNSNWLPWNSFTTFSVYRNMNSRQVLDAQASERKCSTYLNSSNYQTIFKAYYEAIANTHTDTAIQENNLFLTNELYRNKLRSVKEAMLSKLIINYAKAQNQREQAQIKTNYMALFNRPLVSDLLDTSDFYVTASNALLDCQNRYRGRDRNELVAELDQLELAVRYNPQDPNAAQIHDRINGIRSALRSGYSNLAPDPSYVQNYFTTVFKYTLPQTNQTLSFGKLEAEVIVARVIELQE